MSELERLPDGIDLPLDDAAGPARRISAAQASAIVGAALDAWSATASPPPGPSAPRPRAAAGPASARLAWSVAAICALVALGSIAAMATTLTSAPPAAPQPTTTDAPTTAPSTTAAPPTTASTTDAPPPTAAPPTTASTTDAPPPPAAPTTATPATDSRARSARRPAAPRTPDDLLAEANALRAAHRWREAEATYARVPREHPESFSAYVADVAAADVRAAHLGDPRGAQRLYRRALAARPDGPLDVEAREGLARAQRRLGDLDAERATLSALIGAHPSAAAAARGRARLAEMESSIHAP